MSVIARLPTMKMSAIMTLWHNALRILLDPSKSGQHAQARAVIEAIRLEWDQRRSRSFDPAEWFNWPTTEVTGGSGALRGEDWLRLGVLGAVGYKVGATEGLPEPLRHRLLDEVFSGAIPPVGPPEYMDEWGAPRSAGRLRKIAETIASLTRNAQRKRDVDMSVAIQHWEADLGYLFDEYYVGHFQFAWPSTAP